MTFNHFTSCQPIDYINLPLTLMILDDWILVNAVGPDSKEYLQGQFTADVKKINKHQHLLTAHCNSNGKVWSVLRLFHYNNGLSFIERRSLLNLQLTELKKYATFSKVTFIINDEIVLLGIAGLHARIILSNLFDELPEINKELISNGDTTLLWFRYPSERFMLITNKITAKYIIKKLSSTALISSSQQWLSLDIEAGIPIIDITNSGKFIPQAINLQKLNGVSFKKGCYIGQEIIARTKFYNTNKYVMLCLTGIANRIPIAGESIELKINDDCWRRTGTVLAAVQLSSGYLLIQVVVNKNIKLDSMLRVCNDDISFLHIKSLPYSLGGL